MAEASGTPLSAKARQLISIAAGTLVSFGLAAGLHFLWSIAGGFLPVALFAAVNESVWEHVKILSWGFAAWSLIEYRILLPDTRRYLVARVAGVVTVILLTICFFYIYSGILGFSVVWVDIVSAALWLLVGELVTMRLLNSPSDIGRLFPVAAALAALLAVMLLCFTASPPKLGLFRDPVTGLYGLETMP